MQVRSFTCFQRERSKIKTKVANKANEQKQDSFQISSKIPVPGQHCNVQSSAERKIKNSLDKILFYFLYMRKARV